MGLLPTVSVWLASEPENKTDGVGGTINLGYFLDKRNAEEMVQGRGAMGGNGSVNEMTAFVHEGEYYTHLGGDSITVYAKDDPRIAEAALKKLTPLERRLLGR